MVHFVMYFNTRSLELEHCLDAMKMLFSNLLNKLATADKIEFKCIRMTTALMLSVIAKLDSLPSSQEYSVPPAKLRKTSLESIQKFLKSWLAKGGVIGGNRFGGHFSTSWFGHSQMQPKLSREVEVSMMHGSMHSVIIRNNCCSICAAMEKFFSIGMSIISEKRLR